MQQIEAIATKLYGAASIDLQIAGAEGPRAHREAGPGHGAGVHGQDAPVAVARPDCCATGRPASSCPCAALVPSVGAGFVVALCGEMQRMPGLGKTPAFQNIDIDENGNTVGLF